MPYILRNCHEESDQALMQALVHSCPQENLHVADLPYRLSSWALGDSANCGLWLDEDGKLVGWAVMQSPFWTVDYAYQPGLEDLHRCILDWADGRANALVGTQYARPAWFANVFAGQMARRKTLEESGFACQADVGEDSWSKVLMQRPGSLPVKEYRLPAGFVLRSLNGESEVEAYVALHRAVFETKNMTVEWRRRTLHQPGYTPELDVVVAAPDGRLAAFCIGWLCRDAEGLRGQVEPLGCHPDFGRYGLGRIALCEVLRRLQSAGAGEIYVETDSYRNTAFALYESTGFRVIQDVLVYRKDYATEA